MRKLEKFINIAASDNHLGSYYQLARYLGVNPNTVYRARKTSTLSDSHCLRLALIINVSPFLVLAAKNADRAPDRATALLWDTAASTCRKQNGLTSSAHE